MKKQTKTTKTKHPISQHMCLMPAYKIHSGTIIFFNNKQDS